MVSVSWGWGWVFWGRRLPSCPFLPVPCAPFLSLLHFERPFQQRRRYVEGVSSTVHAVKLNYEALDTIDGAPSQCCTCMRATGGGLWEDADGRSISKIVSLWTPPPPPPDPPEGSKARGQ